MRYALSGKNGKACKRTRVIPYVRIRHAIFRLAANGCVCVKLNRSRERFMRQKAQNRMAEVGKSVNMTSYLGVSFHSDKERECKRMGKRMYGIRSFAYRIPHSHAAAACHSRLPRKWNPSLKLGFHIRGKRKRHALPQVCVIRQKWKSM